MEWRAPRPVDIAGAALLTAGTQAEVWAGLVVGAPMPELAVAYLVGTAAMAWHRVAPMTTLTVVLTALAVVPGALGVDAAAGLAWIVTALAVMVSAGYYARRPAVALAVGLGLFALSILLDKGPVVGDIAYAWLLATGAWLAGRAIANRTARAELSEQRAAVAEREAQWRAAAAVADERLRIARELHDVVAHGISVMTLQAGGTRRLLRADQTDERAALEAVERTGRESLAEMHRMLDVLRAPPDPGDTPPAPAPGLARIADLLEPAGVAGLQVVLEVTGEVRPLSPGVDLAAYRIVQEAVTNALRHANASRLRCSIAYAPTAVELTVVDDGIGPASTTPGHGLVGMRERADLYGGSVQAGSSEAGGYTVHAVLPLNQAVHTPTDTSPP